MNEQDYMGAAFYDATDKLWRCWKCCTPLKSDGDCPTCDGEEDS